MEETNMAIEITTLNDFAAERYHRIGHTVISEPQYLQPISPALISDSRRTFDGYAGPKTAQLMTYGDNWRFWVVIAD